MISETERRNLILETIGQLGKFIDMMEDNEEGYTNDEKRLILVLGSYAKQAKLYTTGIQKINNVTKETILK